MSCFLSEAESRWRPRLPVNRSRGGRTQLCDCGQPSPSVCAGVSTRTCRVLLVSYTLFGYVLVLVFVCGWYTSVLFILIYLDSFFSIHNVVIYAVLCSYF